jgi:membrane protease subunit HflC
MDNNGNNQRQVVDIKKSDGSDRIKIPKLTIIVLLIILIYFIISSCTFVVNQNQYAVVRQFGKITRTVSETGLSFNVPFIQSVTKISAAKQYYDIQSSECLSSDKKSMVVDAYVVYEVEDPVLYIQKLNGSLSTAESRIDVLVYNAMKTVISNTTQEELIAARDGIEIEVTDTGTDDDIVLNDAETEETTEVVSINLSDKFLEKIDSQDEAYGIKIESVNIKILDMPTENKEAVYQRMISERENISAAYLAQGESEAQIIKNTTDKEVKILVSEAQAEADKIIGEGEAEYMRILSDAYNDSKKADFYLYVRALDAAKKTMTGENKTLFIDSSSPLAEIFTKTN